MTESRPFTLNELWDIVTQKDVPEELAARAERMIIARLQQGHYHGGQPLPRTLKPVIL